MKTAINPKRQDNFAEWFQAVVKEADLATNSPVRGCMIIRPNGYGLWELIKSEMNTLIEDTGHENLYLPLFIPLSFIAREAEHVSGFAKEMAVVTHHRVKESDGALVPDAEAELTEPMIVRPTSETLFGQHFRENIRSYRDLPILWNQWANVVRWEMRPRLFLRTTEFLWQEGHTAHATAEEAEAETLQMLSVYQKFSEEFLAVPVVSGEKPPNERFPGAVNTYSIEAMMQDGKALQAGTSHYLGTNFSEAQDIKFQSEDGSLEFCHTTSWGVSTRLIGGVIMTHGDDDGFRAPPRIAPKQVVIIPLIRNDEKEAVVQERCAALKSQISSLGYADRSVRVLIDNRKIRPVNKRWDWIKRGAPLVCEIGEREVENAQVTFYQRDNLREGEKLKSNTVQDQEFVSSIPNILGSIQDNLFREASDRLKANISSDPKNLQEIFEYFSDEKNAGWAQVPWAELSAEELSALDADLKSQSLTLRVSPFGGKPEGKACAFSGRAAENEIVVGKAY